MIYPTPRELSAAALDGLEGVTPEHLPLRYLASYDGQGSPTLLQRMNLLAWLQHKLLLRPGFGLSTSGGNRHIGVWPCVYTKADGSDVLFQGANDVPLTAGATNYVYIDHADNALHVSTSGWPAAPTDHRRIGIWSVDAAGVITTEDAIANLLGGGLNVVHDALAAHVLQVSIADAMGSSPCSVTVQMLDRQGHNYAEEVLLEISVWDDALGAVEAANARIAVGGTGSLVRAVVEDKRLVCRTNASGALTILVSDSNSETVYLLAAPAPRSRIIDCSDVGTVQII